jgi:hypothetical protein
MRLAVIAAGVAFLGSNAVAADLTVSVRTAAGAPVPNAVVTVHPAGGAVVMPARLGWPADMVQRNLKFDPFVLLAPVGGQVSFPNQDTVRHHVYSFSATKRFELKLYGRGETRSITFDKAGAAAVGCNIHDGMIGFIKVVDTPFAAKTDAAGNAVIRNVPAGGATMKIWHPYMRGAGNEIARPITLPAQGAISQSAAVDVRTPAAHVHGAY